MLSILIICLVVLNILSAFRISSLESQIIDLRSEFYGELYKQKFKRFFLEYDEAIRSAARKPGKNNPNKKERK